MTDYAYFTDVQKNMDTELDEDAFKERVRDLIREVSMLVEMRTDRRFDHRLEVRYFNARRIGNGGRIAEDGITLLLDDDLQSVVELTNNHTELVDSSVYTLLPTSKSVAHPYHDMIQMTTDSVYWSYQGGRPAEMSIAVNGVWGWGGTWKRHSVLDIAIDADETLLDLSGYSKLDYGKILRIEDEYLEIDDESLPEISPTDISVIRGVNGSQAVSHLDGEDVYVFVPHPVVNRLVKRIVLWQSALDDSPLFGNVTLGDSSQMVDLSAAPKDVKDMLELLSRKN